MEVGVSLSLETRGGRPRGVDPGLQGRQARVVEPVHVVLPVVLRRPIACAADALLQLRFRRVIGVERLQEVVTFFEEPRKTQVKGHGAKALYRFTSEYEEIRLRLKLEINCKEHFNVLDWVDFPFEVNSEWFSGKAQIRTYNINELLGTKLRALYQRSKGRDLFDLDYSRRKIELDTDQIIQCFNEYISFATGNRPPSKKEFLPNMEEKEIDPGFTGDMEALLRPEIEYNQDAAFEWLKNELIERI